ncbi:MAG: AAA+-type ATPase [Alectoria fallacina]|uniref:AAA+-type ATPase n=1 Tax=Alectoria fallacina TaxID=1903189 RepID=A0A8H3J6Q3_9LECA|nr:MAG: AAA+-type ATPase [Alectoria fallacina]
MKEPEYKVRPSSRADPKDVFRIFLSPAQLLLHKVHAGDVCHIVTLHQSPIRPAVVWPAIEKIKDDVVQTSKALQVLYGLKLDSRIFIRRSDVVITDADEITLCEIPQDKLESALPNLDEDGRSHWAWRLKHYLFKAEILAPGMTFERVEANDERRSYRIQSINSSAEPILYRARSSCTVCLKVGDSENANSFEGHKSFLVVPSEGVGGLDKQIEILNDEVTTYSEPQDRNTKMPLFYRACQGGILLHGAPGTGKSTVLRKICEAGWRRVFNIDITIGNHRLGENEAAIEQIFSDALGCQPSVVIIDDLESIAGKQNPTDLARSMNVGQILSRQLDRLDGTQTLAVGATRSLTEIDQDLRRVGRLDFEIEIPVPDSKSRAEVLKVLCNLPKDKAHSTLERVAARTHGFVGADLYKLLRQAVKITRAQDRASDSRIGDFDCRPTDPQALLDSMEDSFNSALRKVRPTIMQEIFLEIPETKWSDIGGQREVKKRIQQALVWPVKYPNEMKQSGLKAKKGLLLYGPPGCSKTMTARATATESGLNFIAVRGAELLSMYVGETERAVREVFGKARAASPSIIFFDEIDAVGAARDNSQQGGIHTVTTLLNELDGFEELKGVFVLAATNKPELLDPALIRAGRLSETLYIGLPDLEARREILQMQTPMTLSDDVDVLALSKMTEGFTGAEIVKICEQASYIAFEEQIQSKERRRICQKHLSTALAEVKRSVTPEMVRRYEAWGAGRH